MSRSDSTSFSIPGSDLCFSCLQLQDNIGVGGLFLSICLVSALSWRVNLLSFSGAECSRVALRPDTGRRPVLLLFLFHSRPIHRKVVCFSPCSLSILLLPIFKISLVSLSLQMALDRSLDCSRQSEKNCFGCCLLSCLLLFSLLFFPEPRSGGNLGDALKEVRSRFFLLPKVMGAVSERHHTSSPGGAVWVVVSGSVSGESQRSETVVIWRWLTCLGQGIDFSDDNARAVVSSCFGSEQKSSLLSFFQIVVGAVPFAFRLHSSLSPAFCISLQASHSLHCDHSISVPPSHSLQNGPQSGAEERCGLSPSTPFANYLRLEQSTTTCD